MEYKKLYIFVEGNNDARFFESIVKPRLLNRYDCVEIITFAQKDKKWKENFIASIKAMGADNIWIFDFNKSPCITQRKQRILEYHKFIDEGSIFIVKMMIESWYMAGISDNICTNYRIKIPDDTEAIGKDEFESLIPKEFDSRIDFMVEICKDYSIDKAIKRNRSFKYFAKRCLGCCNEVM